jgi:hypothetical protein
MRFEALLLWNFKAAFIKPAPDRKLRQPSGVSGS